MLRNGDGLQSRRVDPRALRARGRAITGSGDALGKLDLTRGLLSHCDVARQSRERTRCHIPPLISAHGCLSRLYRCRPAHIGAAGAVPDGLDVLGANDLFGIRPEEPPQPFVLA
jgi:hypothetical protein